MSRSFLQTNLGTSLVGGSFCIFGGCTQMMLPSLSYVKGLSFIWSFTCASCAASWASCATFLCDLCSSSRFRRASRSFSSRRAASSSSSSRSSLMGTWPTLLRLSLLPVGPLELASLASATGVCESFLPPAEATEVPFRAPPGVCGVFRGVSGLNRSCSPWDCTIFRRIGTHARAQVSTRQRGGSCSRAQPESSSEGSSIGTDPPKSGSGPVSRSVGSVGGCVGCVGWPGHPPPVEGALSPSSKGTKHMRSWPTSALEVASAAKEKAFFAR
mmetsp:Transcript_22771/g.67770  ORF Transcript_22771/g.67770 Transcript_22771/m.67770 type:complete len:271 (-) Transcript_22771:111-923(-)